MRPETAEDMPSLASAWAVRLAAEPLPAPERQALTDWLAGDNCRRRELDEARAVLRVSSALTCSETARAWLDKSLRTIDGAAPLPFGLRIYGRRVLFTGIVSALVASALFAAAFLPHRT